MASRIMDRPWVFGKAQKRIVGSFATNGASSPVASTIKGKGIASILRIGAGAFEITLDDPYYSVWGEYASVRAASAAALFTQFGAFSNVGTATPVSFVLRTVNGSGTGIDLAADANNRVSFEVMFEDSSAFG